MSDFTTPELTLQPVQTPVRQPQRNAQRLDGRHLEKVAGFTHLNLLDLGALQAPERSGAPMPQRLLAAVPVLAALVGVAVTLWFDHQLHEQKARTAQVQQQLQARTAELQARTGVASGPSATEQRAALQAAVAQERQRLAPLRGLAAGAEPGPWANPALTMQGLAAIQTPGLWLTQVTLDTEQQTLRLLGRALEAAPVTAHVQAMAEQPLFQGLQVQALNLTLAQAAGAASQPTGAQSLVDFELLTGARSVVPAPPARAARAQPSS